VLESAVAAVALPAQSKTAPSPRPLNREQVVNVSVGVEKIEAARGTNRRVERLLVERDGNVVWIEINREDRQVIGVLSINQTVPRVTRSGLLEELLSIRRTEQHARAAEIILEEEADHEVFASRQLGDAVERFGIDEVNEALRNWIPRAINFFGPPGTGFTYDCIRYGLKTRDNKDLAELYTTMLTRRCDQLGLTMPALTATYPHTLA